MNREILKQAGIEYESGIRRYLDDAEVYELLLIDFCSDDQLRRSTEAFIKKDRKRLLEIVHEVKGTSSNLDMARLCEAASELVLALRDSRSDKGRIEELYRKYADVYAESKEAVKRAHTDGVSG